MSGEYTDLQTLDSETNLNAPVFLEKMKIDNPKFAEDIVSRIPEWRKKVDELSGVEGTADMVLDTLEYVDKETIMKHITNVAQEVEEVLAQNPSTKIKFLAVRSDGGSQKWFFDEVKGRLNAERRDNLELESDNLIEEDADSVLFFVDDSINSGMQFNRLANEVNIIASNTGKNVDFRLRCLRVNEAGGYFRNARRSLENNKKVSFSQKNFV